MLKSEASLAPARGSPGSGTACPRESASDSGSLYGDAGALAAQGSTPSMHPGASDIGPPPKSLPHPKSHVRSVSDRAAAPPQTTPSRVLTVHECIPDCTLMCTADQNNLQILDQAHIRGHVGRLRHRGIEQSGTGDAKIVRRIGSRNRPFSLQNAKRLQAAWPRASTKPNCSWGGVPLW